jgi:hypothetical protein
VIEVLVVVFQLIRPLPTVELPMELPGLDPGAESRARATSQDLGPSRGIIDDIPSLSEHLAKPIFATAAAEPQAQSASSTASPSAQVNALAARLSLVGIVDGDPPQAIIEDSQTKKTFFVTKGQGVIEGAVLQDVQDTRVILLYQGEPIELSL